MSLREICEDLTGKTTTSEVIPAAAPLLFNFPIDFYDPDKKTDFLEKWIRHFYMREIGLETVDYFMLRLQDKFDTILPYFNKRFSMVASEYDPLINETIDESITHDKNETRKTTGKDTSNTTATSEGTTSSTTESEANTLHTESEYPQGNLTDFQDNIYLSRASKDTGSNSTTVSGTDHSESTNNGTVDSTRDDTLTGEATEKRTAKNTRGSIGSLMREYDDALKNVTEEFYNACEDLFMGLWL